MGNFEEDDVQMPLKLVKELLKQQESTLKVFLSAFMDSVNTRIDNLMKGVQSVKSSLEFTQAQVEELITSDLRVKEVKLQIEDLGNKLDDLKNRSRRNNLCFEGIPESPNETWQESESKIKHLISSHMPEVGTDFVIESTYIIMMLYLFLLLKSFKIGNQIHQYSTRYSDFYRPHSCRTNI